MVPRTIRARVIGLAVVALGVGLPAQAPAATITVSGPSDDFAGCTLREAINSANGVGPAVGCTAGDALGTDTIVLPANADPYSLTNIGVGENGNATGDLDITSNVLIRGAGAASTRINGVGADRVFHVASGVSELRDLTVTNGGTPDGADSPQAADGASPGDDSVGAAGESVIGTSGGGGILVGGTLTLTRVVVTGNSAGGGGDGGAAGAGGDVVVGGTGGDSVGGNGGSGANGGGIAVESGTLTAVDSTITLNAAGAGGAGGAGGAAGDGGDNNAVGGTGSDGGDSTGGIGGGGGSGGGIAQSVGNVTLVRTVVSNNSGGTAGPGGAAGAGGASGNGDAGDGAGGSSEGGSSNGGGQGGGIDAGGSGAQTTITGSTIRGNQGGSNADGGAGGAGGNGGFGQPGTSTGGGGGAGGRAGGMSTFNVGGGSVSITRSAIVENSAGDGGDGGAAGAAGTSTSGSGSTQGGSGQPGAPAGGLQLVGDTITFSNVTVADNRAGDGGGGGAAGTGAGTNTPGGGGSGGGQAALTLVNNSSATLRFSTIASNDVGAGGTAPTGGTDGSAGVNGGIHNEGTGNLTLQNTIVAYNDDTQCTGNTTDGGFNISFPHTGSELCSATLHADPTLAPLANNGGPSPTRRPLLGSPAINGVPAGDATCSGTDQRGVVRPKGAGCDIGAVERSFPVAITGGASAIAALSAKVAGTVGTGQLPTTYRFRFGKTAAYGSLTPSVSVGAGTTPVAALATLKALAPNTIYHYRLVVSNPDGSAQGQDRTFKTKPLPFAGVKIVSTKAKAAQGAVRIRLGCPKRTSLTRCTGRLKLTTRVKKDGKTTTLKLGSANFTIPTGETRRVKVGLSAAGLARLLKKGTLNARARARAVDARSGKPVVKTGAVTLTAP